MAQATISIRLGNEYSDIKLVVSTNSGLLNPIYSNSHSTVNRTVKITMSNLTPNTQYYYGVMIKGVLQTKGRGMFKTFPEGASNFTCAFASCAESGSNHQVFETIRNLNPLFFIHMGDIHYSDIITNNPNLYRNAFDTVFTSPRQAKLYSEIPIAYMWDDHDFGNNINGDKNNPAKDSAIRVYRERVPHYPTPANNELDAVYQSWVCGRVRFILTDLRSQADNYSIPDNVSKSIMGEKQLQWFFDELTKPEPLKIWVNTRPWIGEASLDEGDIWKAFSHERKRIANFISENNLEGHVAIVSGDMHGIAIDDGTNSDYSDSGNASIPVFQAAPLHRTPSVKGGPWTSGSFPNASDQFGIMNIVDNGGETITVEWIAKRGNEVLINHNFAVNSTMPEDVRAPIIKANPIGGSYTESQVIALTANEEATIYYTLDGTEPTINSNVYMYPIEISDDITLKYFGIDLSNNASQAQTENYVFIDDNTAPIISASVLDGETFSNNLEIELTTNEPSTIYYTLNGDTPTTSSAVYNGKITVYNTTALKYFGVDTVGNASTVKTFNYVKVPVTEGVTPTHGMRAWVDAKSSASITDGDGKVSQITDLSGNNAHLTQPTANNQPILVRDAFGSGRHTIRFNGSSAYLKNDNFSATFNKSATVVLVTSLKDPDGATQRLIDLAANTSSLRYLQKSGTTDNLASQNSLQSSQAAFNVRNLPTEPLHIITNLITHEKSTMYLNGVESGYTLDSNPNLNTINRIALGATVIGGNFYNGDISEMIIYNRTLTSEELTLLHSDLGKKWTVNVPEIPRVPDNVSNVTASNLTHNSLTLLWSASTNAESYHVYQNGTLIGNTTSPTYTIMNLTPATNYTFGIIAKNNVGDSSLVTIPVMTLPVANTEAPSNVTNLIVSDFTENSVSVTWSSSVNATSYDILINGSLVVNQTNTNYTVVDLTQDTTYTITVVAKNTNGSASGVSVVQKTDVGQSGGYITSGLLYKLEGDIPENHVVNNSTTYFSELNPFTITFAYSGALSKLAVLMRGNGGVDAQNGVNISRTANNRLTMTGRATDIRTNVPEARIYSTGSSVFEDKDATVFKHVTYVRDISTGFVSLYINGVKVGDNNVFGNNYSILSPGAENLVLNGGAMEMKDFIVYNRALTTAEVLSNYNVFLTNN